MKQTKKKSPSKNLSKKTTKYRSNYESQVAELMTNLGLRFEYESESFGYIVTKLYKTDWKIILPNGRSFFLETKGYLDPRSRVALACMSQQHPEVPLEINFMKNNKGYKAFADKYAYDSTVGLDGLERRLREISGMPSIPDANPSEQNKDSDRKAPTRSVRSGRNVDTSK